MRSARRERFPVNVWPPMVDAVTLVLAAFVLIMLVGLVAQRGLVTSLREKERQLQKLEEDRERLRRRLQALSAGGTIEVEEGKVILQGEVLFASGSDELVPAGRETVAKLVGPLRALLDAEPDQMVLIGGHTDDRPISTGRFPSNWELSAARALAVARVLVDAGLDPGRVVPSGFGAHHPRASNDDVEGRGRNRRIEVLIVPIRAVSSR
jgi:flagellar motor protein MotB